MSQVIESAVKFALSIANNSAHGYSQDVRWGPDYDCSSLMIAAYEQAGVPVKTMGATYTGNMKSVFLKCGFEDVTRQCNLSSGYGTRRGDVLLNELHHTAMVVKDNGGQIVHASINEKGTAHGGKVGDQTGREICTRSYYNKPWDCVLRYTAADVVDIEEYRATGIAAVNTSLSVRSAPSVNAVKMAEFAPNDVIYITGKCNNGWYRCLVSGGNVGYVSGDYVSDIQETEKKSDEYTAPNDIVWELGHRGIVLDTEGMLAEINANPNSRLYWLARAIVKYIRERE